MNKIIKKSIEIGGRELSLEIGRFAAQADSSVLARYGDTMVLATVVSGPPKPELGYFPLTVEYLERLYAGGRIKGSRWVKREGRPSDEAILAGRLIDRSIRPLFPKDYFNEVQVTVTILSVDLENTPEIPAAVAASAALAISAIPWEGPIGTVRVGFKDGAYFANPVNGETKSSEIDLTVSASRDKVIMLEAQAQQMPEEQILGAIEFAKKEIGKIIDLIDLLVKEAGQKKRSYQSHRVDPEVKNQVRKVLGKDLSAMMKKISGKELESAEMEELKQALEENLAEAKKSEVDEAFEAVLKEEVRKQILAGKRPDGRGAEEIRPISAEVGVLPRTHGSAVFARGETQVLTVTTLGTPSLEQLIESPEGEETKRFIHHYSMPPYSTGQTGRIGTPSRREIGHGALAEKALLPVVPSAENFPYTIRLVSEVMSSNGSTSMASSCGSSLSLMDAGVPIISPVAGLALGLVSEGEKTVILTDIIGLEDFYGEMDFKVAGTEKGVTAIQLDVKNHGLGKEILKEVFDRAKKGREFILAKMLAVLDKSRTKISQYAPKVAVLHVPPEKIGEVIGPGGRMIRKIIEETKTTVDVEDDGTVNISGIEEEAVNKAVSFIKTLTREVKPGEIYEGTVRRIQSFGAFVEIGPGKEGLVHVSQMGTGYVNSPAEVVSVGQKVKVRVAEIDEQGRINLSMILDPSQVRETPAPAPRRIERRPSGFASGNLGSFRTGRPQFRSPFSGPRPPRRRF